MLRLTYKLFSTPPQTPHFTLTMPYERRIITRQRVTLDQGQDAGLLLERGTTLKANDYLQAETGEIIQVQAALETVSTVHCSDALLLARLCYHLGNRHIPVAISSTKVSYLHDHVLDDMVRGLGLSVVVEQATFEPESGAYASGHGHSHSHSHQHHHEH